MKKLSILLIAFVALVGFNACTSDDDVVFIAQPDPEGISFANTFSPEYILTRSTSENTVERFVWNPIDLDVPTNINYDVLVSASEEMTDPALLGSTAGTNLAVKVKQLMNFATEELELDNDPTTEAPNAGTMYVQVVATAGTAGEMIHASEVQPLNVVIPEETSGEIEIPRIYVVGNFQEAGGYGSNWSPENGVPLAASDEGKTDFEGFVYLNDAKPLFKFVPTTAGWDGNLGEAGDSEGVYTKTLKPDGPNAGTPDGTGGYYWIKVDTEKLTYSLTKVDWGVIGNATPTGWDSDTDMVYNPETQLWTVTLDLTQQEPTDNGFKFRANDGWDINLGDTGADGILEFGGDNIGVPEDGNYTITLNLSNPRNYTYSLTKN